MAEYDSEKKILGIEKGFWKECIIPTTGLAALTTSLVAAGAWYIWDKTSPRDEILKACDLPNGTHIEEMDSINARHRTAHLSHEFHIVVTTPDGETRDLVVPFDDLTLKREMSIDEAFERLCAGEEVKLVERPPVPN